MRAVAVLALVASLATPIAAQHAHRPPVSAYAGQEGREIAALSADDIAQLARGGGWGFALPAELNGHPGPMHLLELLAELGLSEAQTSAIQAIFERMRAEAVAEGTRFVTAERALDQLFRTGRATEDTLRAAIAEAEASRARLRTIHLSAHLSTLPLLTADQIRRYPVLRGYRADPCAAVPAGHDPVMWRRHNNCG